MSTPPTTTALRTIRQARLWKPARNRRHPYVDNRARQPSDTIMGWGCALRRRGISVVGAPRVSSKTIPLSGMGCRGATSRVSNGTLGINSDTIVGEVTPSVTMGQVGSEVTRHLVCYLKTIQSQQRPEALQRMGCRGSKPLDRW